MGDAEGHSEPPSRTPGCMDESRGAEYETNTQPPLRTQQILGMFKGSGGGSHRTPPAIRALRVFR